MMIIITDNGQIAKFFGKTKISSLITKNNSNNIQMIAFDTSSSLSSIAILIYNTHTVHHEIVKRSLPIEKNPQNESLSMMEGLLYEGKASSHYIDLFIGHPIPQKQTLIIDTGSDFIGFPCYPECQDNILCGSDNHLDSLYNSSLSSTFEKLECEDCVEGFCVKYPTQSDRAAGPKQKPYCKMAASYVEGSSWFAYEAKDIVTLQSSSVSDDENNNDDSITSLSSPSNSSLQPITGQSTDFYLRFGCQTKITGNFKTQQADGIAGMSPSRNSLWRQIIASSSHRNKRMREQFSLCLKPQKDPFQSIIIEGVQEENTRNNSTNSSSALSAGVLTFGDIDHRLLPTGQRPSYAQMSSNIFYNVFLKAVYLKEDRRGSMLSTMTTNSYHYHKLDISPKILNKGGVIVDSGSTLSYLTPYVYTTQFMELWKKITGLDDYPRSFTRDELSKYYHKLPTFVLQLQGSSTSSNLGTLLSSEKLDASLSSSDILIEIPPSSYIVYSENKGKFYNHFAIPHQEDIYADDPKSAAIMRGNGGSLLGSSTLQGYLVSFNMENNEMGFFPSSCDYSNIDAYYDRLFLEKERGRFFGLSSFYTKESGIGLAFLLALVQILLVCVIYNKKIRIQNSRNGQLTSEMIQIPQDEVDSFDVDNKDDDGSVGQEEDEPMTKILVV